MTGESRTGEEFTAWRMVALALASCVLALACMFFARDHGQVAAIWPGNAVVLAVLLQLRKRAWLAWTAAGTAGYVAANLIAGDHTLNALTLPLCNAVEILAAAAICRKLAGHGSDSTRPKQLFALVAAAGIAPLASALGAYLILGGPPLEVLPAWYAADALGLLVVTPILLVLAADRSSLAAAFQDRRNLAPALVMAAALAVVFGQSAYPLLPLLFPPLVWCAFAMGAGGTAVVLIVTIATAVAATLNGAGPMTLMEGGMAARLGVLQVVLACVTLVALPVAAVLTERQRVKASLRAALERVGESEARYRMLADSASDVILKVDAAATIRYASPSISQFGYAAEDLVGRPIFEFVHPDDRAELIDRVGDILGAGVIDPERPRTYRILTKDGGYVWAEGNPTVVRDANGDFEGIVTQIRDISARKAAEAALAHSEARYRMLADNASDLVIKIDAQGVVEYVSPSIRRLGYEPEEIIGGSPLAFVHPDDVQAVKARMLERRRTGHAALGADQTYRILGKHGGCIWVESNPSVIRGPDGSIASVISQLRDITARKAQEAALAESGDRYRMLADHATDVVIKVDAQDTVLYVSPSVRRYGYEPDDMVGVSGYTLVHPEDLPKLRALIAELFRAGFVDTARDRTYRLRTAAGDYVWMEGSPSLVRNEAGEVEAVISQLRDVSARVALEAELLAARDDAEAAAATKAEFMANMSHEIRTPLTAVLGFTSLLAGRTDLSDEARAKVDRIGAASQAMLAIVNDILDFSKLEAGLMPVTPRPARPLEVLETALSLFEPQAAAKGLSLVFRPEELPPNVRLDPDRIRQVLLNLIGNAVKFTEAGAVEVQASYDTAGQRLKVAVRDSGAGMTDEQQAVLFQRFSQVDGAAARAGGGTGLGLAISRGLVEAMGGKIGLTSAPGEGSTFTFEIPAPECEPVETAPEASPLSAVAGLRVLLADDNATNRELAQAVMAQFEIDVTDAADGAEAVELAGLLPYDVILMDIRMPGMDGPTAARAIRSEPGPNQTTPILAFSADHELDAEAAGLFDGHVRKPIEVAPLLAALAEATAWEDAVYDTAAEG